MSSSTATQTLPTPWLKLDAARSARQISASRAPFAIWMTMSFLKLVSGSCMTTRFTLRMLQVCRRCCVKIGSEGALFIKLDSDGGTWVVKGTQIASLRGGVAGVSEKGFSCPGGLLPGELPRG